MSRIDTLRRALDAYAQFYEQLAPERLDGLAALLAPDVRFKDPFNDVRGPADMIRVLRLMYDHGTPRFEMRDRAVGTERCYLRWRYTSTRDGHNAPWIIEGMSELRFDDAGRLVEHVDHWDAAEQVYERLPLIGWLIRRIKRRLQLKT
ncbi:MAG: nuclear transport factor 2 family protein [Proteobacteria bacterium]|nr:nuclear transport factor 2 family protein [Pseudomonadota bacterium]